MYTVHLLITTFVKITLTCVEIQVLVFGDNVLDGVLDVGLEGIDLLLGAATFLQMLGNLLHVALQVGKVVLLGSKTLKITKFQPTTQPRVLAF